MWDLIVSVPDHCLSFYFSFSGETRFALSNASGKTHKQALLGLLRAGKGSIYLDLLVLSLDKSYLPLQANRVG